MSTDHAEDFNIALGAVIRREMKVRGLTLQTLGESVGVSYQQVGKYVWGQNALSAHRLHQFAQALGVSVAHLYEQAGAPAEVPEPSAAASDGILAARYVSKIRDATLRGNVIDFTRKLAYSAGEVA